VPRNTRFRRVDFFLLMDPRTQSHPRNSKFSAHCDTTEYGTAAGSGDDDGCEKQRLAIAKTWQER
jgi:hypothetical protein